MSITESGPKALIIMLRMPANIMKDSTNNYDNNQFNNTYDNGNTDNTNSNTESGPKAMTPDHKVDDTSRGLLTRGGDYYY